MNKLESSQAPIPATATCGFYSKALLAGTIAFLGSFCCLVAFWYREIRPYYFPLGDEFSLIVNSARPFHPALSAWLLRGFSSYFEPYPGWPATGTNFLRPVANAEVYLSSLLFRVDWSRYLLSNYVIQSALVGCATFLAAGRLKLRPLSIVVIGLVCFFSPAFDNGALFSTAFPFDLLAACFVLAGLGLLLSERLIPAWICFSFGVFTKETALFAPLAAALALYASSSHRGPRRLLAPVCFLFPYPAWEALRWIAFRGTTGNYAVGTGRPDLWRLARNLLRWPFPFPSPLGVKFAFGFIPLSFSVCVFATLNFCFWIVFAVSLLRWVRSKAGFGDHNPLLGEIGFVSSADRILLLFCAGSVAILLLIPNLEPRFSATFLPLFALSLATVSEKSPRGVLRAAALSLLVIPLIMNVAIRARSIAADLLSARAQWAMAADYIHKISSSSAPMIFTVDDLTGGYSSTRSIKRFAGYAGQLVRVDDLFEGPNCAAQPAIDVHRTFAGEIEIVSTTSSSCSGHLFLGAGYSPIGAKLLERKVGVAEILYQGLPRFPPHSISIPGQLILEITHAPASSLILFPDLSLRGYREVRVDRAGP